ncbi:MULTISPECIES: hypothetical protein [Bacillus cereus group]|uniref:Group-specific protein n=1 Tax=Bacillus cereus HuB4-4 TaxID=1053211 RepID=A0A9W5VIA6_BACCE|nr:MULTISPECIES: hypothetical protein [Bacillus cereus group]EOP79222.1 hypothetical protein IGM_06432 [Bacillus cereus HuB4-4]KXY94972.1 hypothetical protein AT279_00395 [Bacillus cereus]MCU4880343.1 hypothetical protein [Bacillus cereus]MCU5353761.1 hypothetical protein [Bacillus cereus]MEC0008430.1 hypothetical protein [Bacillus cereus]
MARKIYKAGDRANVYIKKDISPDMIDFINKQSDLTMFFLYAAQQLHKQIGNVDVAEILPRKYTFALDNETQPLPIKHDEGSKPVHTPVPDQTHIETSQEITNPGESNDKEENTSWNKLNDLEDDPYA